MNNGNKGVISLSYMLNENSPNYGGVKGAVKIKNSHSIQAGNTSNNLTIELPNHISTHIDFPKHFDENGKTLSDYPSSFWFFKKIGFIECSVERLPEMISGLPGDIDLLILKTGFGSQRSNDVYWAEQPIIPANYALLLKKTFPKLRVFGFDLLSLTSQLNKKEGKEAHVQFLLENDILVLEDMNLTELFKTPSQVIIAPLLIENADGSLCTVFAL